MKRTQTRASVQRSHPAGAQEGDSDHPRRQAPQPDVRHPWLRHRHGGRLHGRRRASKVLFVGTGAGPWHTSDGLTYGDGTLEAVGRTGCDPYGRNPTGSRDYDDSEFNAVSCERRYGKRPLDG